VLLLNAAMRSKILSKIAALLVHHGDRRLKREWS